MNQPVSHFMLRVALLCGVLVALQFVYNMQAPAAVQSPFAFGLLGFFAAVTILVHLFLLRASQGNGAAFVRQFTLATTLKFFLYMLVIITLFMLLPPEGMKAIVLHFIFYYAVFTVFEVGMLYRALTRG